MTQAKLKLLKFRAAESVKLKVDIRKLKEKILALEKEHAKCKLSKETETKKI